MIRVGVSACRGGIAIPNAGWRRFHLHTGSVIRNTAACPIHHDCCRQLIHSHTSIVRKPHDLSLVTHLDPGLHDRFGQVVADFQNPLRDDSFSRNRHVPIIKNRLWYISSAMHCDPVRLVLLDRMPLGDTRVQGSVMLSVHLP